MQKPLPQLAMEKARKGLGEVPKSEPDHIQCMLTGVPHAINDHGVVVGSLEQSGKAFRPIVQRGVNRDPVLLATPGHFELGEALAINFDGNCVGTCWQKSQLKERVACFWSWNGRVRILPRGPYVSTVATAINDQDVVVGYGVRKHDGHREPIVWRLGCSCPEIVPISDSVVQAITRLHPKGIEDLDVMCTGITSNGLITLRVWHIGPQSHSYPLVSSNMSPAEFALGRLWQEHPLEDEGGFALTQSRLYAWTSRSRKSYIYHGTPRTPVAFGNDERISIVAATSRGVILGTRKEDDSARVCLWTPNNEGNYTPDRPTSILSARWVDAVAINARHQALVVDRRHDYALVQV